MRLINFLVLATLASGCLPLAQSTNRTTGRTLGKLVVDQPGPVELFVDRDARTIIVSALRKYRCEREVVDHVEVATSTEARMIGTTDGDSWGWWLLWPMVGAWPIGIADLVIANTVALLTPDSSGHNEIVAGVLRSECRAPVRTNVYVALASGQEMQALTDQHGIAAFVLPAGEDPRTAHVRSDEPAAPEPELEPEVIVDGVIIMPNERELTTTSTRPPATTSPPAPSDGFVGVSRVLRACGAEHRTTGTVNVTLVIENGRVTRVDLDRHERAFVACVQAKVGTVAFEPTRTGTVRVPFKIDPGGR